MTCEVLVNYEQLRAAWNEALTEAGMWSYLAPPIETVDLLNEPYVPGIHPLWAPKEVEPFHVSARLRWTWDTMQAARTATTEEDALMLFLGDEGRGQDTEQPWL